MGHFILALSCPDTSGIVANVSTFIFNMKMNIIKSNQFSDSNTKRFFMRIEFTSTKSISLDSIRERFAEIGQKFNMEWTLHDNTVSPTVIIMVSKFDHCLIDILYQTKQKRLNINIIGVISNHEDTRDLVERENIPFYYRPRTTENKDHVDEHLLELLEETKVDLVVLARYMQILPPRITNKFPSKIINIHHSFLPSFKGANPYKHAFERGVKMIGATAHYVTEALDEGPIITQNVMPIHHDMNIQDMVYMGQKIEQSVLIKAITAHTEHKIFLNHQKTIVF